MAAISGQTPGCQHFFLRNILHCSFYVISALKRNRKRRLDLFGVPVITHRCYSLEQNEHEKEVGILGVDEEPCEDILAKTVIVTKKASVVIISNDVCACHCLHTAAKSPKPVIENFIRHNAKHQMMKKKQI